MPRADLRRMPHPKDPNGFSMTARFDIETFRVIQKLSQDDKRSLNFTVNRLVREGIESFQAQGLIDQPK
jgi:hypothetical protein